MQGQRVGLVLTMFSVSETSKGRLCEIDKTCKTSISDRSHPVRLCSNCSSMLITWPVWICSRIANSKVTSGGGFGGKGANPPSGVKKPPIPFSQEL